MDNKFCLSNLCCFLTRELGLNSGKTLKNSYNFSGFKPSLMFQSVKSTLTLMFQSSTSANIGICNHQDNKEQIAQLEATFSFLD